MLLKKFEVYFTNGLVKEFPNVKISSIKKTDEILTFRFGEDEHAAYIRWENVNYIEQVDC